jgi:hypothetical protein
MRNRFDDALNALDLLYFVKMRPKQRRKIGFRRGFAFDKRAG